ncbi:hypothetical protein EUGRSUZ_H02126 [Eucalyptus grandis]|uniref:Uncharacterized protein n=2 Tax=Eucalyptus grandis TaxID=71139 RepID=A0ACC3JQ78_EUCGR|nr:hypothetical protein EUGRSUZ_H02126 [Eucalyptus grandis]
MQSITRKSKLESRFSFFANLSHFSKLKSSLPQQRHDDHHFRNSICSNFFMVVYRVKKIRIFFKGIVRT